MLNHGVFTWGDTARQSYERALKIVSVAEQHLARTGAIDALAVAEPGHIDRLRLARLRRAVSRVQGHPVISQVDTSASANGFASRRDAAQLVTRGPITPDHVIRTKRVAMVVGSDNVDTQVDEFARAYAEYFAAHTDGSLTPLPPAPRWAIWPGTGTVAFGLTAKAANQVADIVRHTTQAIQWAEAMGGWKPLPPADIFRMEYWALEQAKLHRGRSRQAFSGKIALVTGAAGGFGHRWGLLG